MLNIKGFESRSLRLDVILLKPYTHDHLKDIKSTFETFECDWIDYIDSNTNKYSIKSNIDNIISDTIKDYIGDEKNQIYDEEDIKELKEKTSKEYASFYEELDFDYDFSEDEYFKEIDFEDLISENCFHRDTNDFNQTEDTTIGSEENQIKNIDILFSKREQI